VKIALLALLMLQIAQQGGVVSGVVHGADGKPASGIRVFAIEAPDGNDTARTSSALVSISVTDGQGRYRLEVAAGRYRIASGSVETPTYSPGTSDISAAQVIRITPGAAIANVDFSTFVPPLRTLPGITFVRSTGSTGVLSGVLRYADGSPAPGLPVSIVAPVASIGTLNPAAFAATQFPASPRTQTTSDVNGRYLFDGVAPGTYFIAAGYAESPTFYPGAADMQSASAITTTPTTKLNTLDFTVPQQPAGVRVRGRITAAGQIPASGAMVRVLNQSANARAAMAIGLPPRTPPNAAPVGMDGQVEYLNVLPGTYVLEARLAGAPDVLRNIVVTDSPVEGLEISIPISVFSGRIVWEDGTPVPTPKDFGEAIVTTVNHPNMIMSIVMPISAAGTFVRPMESDEYRFRLRTLPEGYTIKSITAAGRDLLKETIAVGPLATVNVEIRVGKKDRSEPGEVRLTGKVLDAVRGAPAVAEGIVLCCRESGITEKFSTPLRSDGSFEFTSIPPGRYTAVIQVPTGSPGLFPVNPVIDVGSNGVSGMEILSAQRFFEVIARTLDEAGRPVNAGPSVSVAFVGTSPRNRVVATSDGDGNWSALLPGGDVYTAMIENLPSGYSLKSTGGPIDFRTVVPAANAIGSPRLTFVSITLSSP
jgi:hypothetical protein